MKHSIQNYFAYNDKLASGAQPSEKEIQDLKEDGFEVIVNISPSSTRNALANEASLAEQQNFDYIHFPVDCSNLRPIHYQTFEGIMNGTNGKKVFVHCGGNIKSSNLIHMYQVIAKGVDEGQSLETLYQIQTPEQKWFDYFKSFGMKG